MTPSRIIFAAAVASALLGAVPASATRSADVTTSGSQAPANAIPSDAEGALPVPQDWNCDRIRPEYREWLRTGHDKNDWRFAGKTYRAVDTGEVYDWNDWLRWARTEKCAGFAQASNSRYFYGAAIWAAGMALLLTAFGKGGPDSPG